jgi:nicotinamidase-related amidase
MLTTSETVLVVIDVQGKLAAAMHDRERLLDALQRLIQGARVLALPVLWLEQNPAGLGSTVPEISALLSGLVPIAKRCFSACGSARFLRELKALRRPQVLLAGIEAHVCVYQTARDLRQAGYRVEVVADAVSSRTPENKAIGLEKMRLAGVGVTSVETALFELLRVAEGVAFKEILRLVR